LPDVIIITGLFALSLVFLIPLLFSFSSAFTDENELLRNGYNLFPAKFSLDAFRYLFGTTSKMSDSILLSFYITILGTALGVIVTCLMSYTLSVKDLPFKRILTFVCVVPMYFYGGLIPSYMIYSQFGLTNTSTLLLLIQLVNPFGVIMMRNGFRSVPQTLYEAARIDGAGEGRIFLKIAMPLVKPMIATISLMLSVTYWNDWMNPMYYTTSDKLVTLQLLIYRMMSRTTEMTANSGTAVTDSLGSIPVQSLKMALVVVAVAPILIAYPFLQRYFVQGATLGAVKE